MVRRSGVWWWELKPPPTVTLGRGGRNLVASARRVNLNEQKDSSFSPGSRPDGGACPSQATAGVQDGGSRLARISER